MHTFNGDGHVIEVVDVTRRSDGVTEVTFVDRNTDRVWREDLGEAVLPDRLGASGMRGDVVGPGFK